MSSSTRKVKALMVTAATAFALMLSVPLPSLTEAQEGQSSEELKESYRKMYEQMKKNQEKKASESSGKNDDDREKKIAEKKQKAREMMRQREEARRKAKEKWLNDYQENTAKLVAVDDAPDLSRSPRAPEGMAYVPRGKFLRGQDWGEWSDNQPSQVIFLNSYFIDIDEVTVGKYLAYLKELKKPVPFSLKDEEMGGDNKPVFKVNWQKAADYCAHYGKRLPTEAEWEKGARGWDSRYFPWGNEFPDEGGEYRANYDPGTRGMDGALYTADVGTFKNGASPYGLNDMSGNIAEWTSDWYDEAYYSVKAGKNPKGPDTGTQKVVRGGGYDVSRNNLLLTTRIAADPKVSNNFIGFRCAKDAD